METRSELSLRERERERERRNTRCQGLHGWRLSAALVPLMLAAPLSHSAQQQQQPACPYPPTSSSDPATFEHRWAGLLYSAFSLDGSKVWTGEDGGRIRHRNSSGVWSFQPVPLEVRGIVRNIFFLPNELDGWAVSSDGWILHTEDGGTSWITLTRLAGSFDLSEWEDLQKIWMLSDGDNGILLGVHGIWYTENGGVCWQRADLYHPDDPGPPVTVDQELYFETGYNAFYGLDARVDSNEAFIGFAVGAPGVIYRSTDFGETWLQVSHYNEFDFQSLPSSMSCLVPTHHGDLLYDYWDVAIRDHETDPFAVVVGGKGNGCGMILSSADNGGTWQLELHECDADPQTLDCPNNPLYNSGGQDPAFRHKRFRTLYGVTLFDDSNVALAVGYNGQHLRRELFNDPLQPLWRDRSRFGHISDAPLDVIVFPFWCVDAVQGTDLAFSVGTGGHVLVSDDAGESWDHELLGEPFRTTSAFLREVPLQEDRGWIVGQFYRIAWTTDGGKSWDAVDPAPTFPPSPNCYLNDITFAGNLEYGVTVGCSAGTNGNGPKILYVDRFDATAWEEPTQVTYTANQAHYENHGQLKRVAWGAGSNTTFWAVGMAGLILHTTDGGDTWTQVEVPLASTSDQLDFHVRSVAAMSGGYVAFVGQYQGQAMAWIHNPSIPSWLEITPVDAAITVLTDVTIHGTTVYAVGQRDLGAGAVEGIVLATAGSPPKLEATPGPYYPDGIPDCPQGSPVLVQAGIRTLTKISFDSDDNLWIAGLCGRIWELPDSASNWVEHKSRMGSDFECLQFLSPDRAYATGSGGEHINQNVIRLNR